MINKNIFREYDIRGVYPHELNENTAYIIGKSYGSYIQEKLGENIATVGMDNRYSSPALHENLIKGLLETGCNVIDLGLVTTPMYFYACIKTNTHGIMITASHNPKDDNGFKFCFDNLGNARGKQVYDFRDYTLLGNFKTGKGKVINYDIRPSYIDLYKEDIKLGKKRIKVVVDCGNGTTSIIAKDIYSLFPIDLVMLFDDSDSTFPNHHPDPAVEENLTKLKEKVLEVKADIGIAFDGDGDRIGVIDNEGQYLSVDKLMAIFVIDLINKVDKKEFLYDVKCSKALEDVITSLHAKPILCRTGASYTRAKINEDNIPFGGEYSGHLVFKDRMPGFDSGIYAGLRLLEILSNVKEQLSDITKMLPKYYNSPEIKIKTTDEKKFKIIEEVATYAQEKNYKNITIDGNKIIFPDSSWALIRASNTGPNLTLRFEALTKERLEALQKEFLDLVHTLL